MGDSWDASNYLLLIVFLCILFLGKLFRSSLSADLCWFCGAEENKKKIQLDSSKICPSCQQYSSFDNEGNYDLDLSSVFTNTKIPVIRASNLLLQTTRPSAHQFSNSQESDPMIIENNDPPIQPIQPNLTAPTSAYHTLSPANPSLTIPTGCSPKIGQSKPIPLISPQNDLLFSAISGSTSTLPLVCDICHQKQHHYVENLSHFEESKKPWKIFKEEEEAKSQLCSPCQKRVTTHIKAIDTEIKMRLLVDSLNHSDSQKIQKTQKRFRDVLKRQISKKPFLTLNIFVLGFLGYTQPLSFSLCFLVFSLLFWIILFLVVFFFHFFISHFVF